MRREFHFYINTFLKKYFFLFCLLCSVLSSLQAQEGEPQLSEERIILQTQVGDLVLALYPEVAPEHCQQILKLARLGAYDTTHFFRVVPGFVAQLSTVHDRTVALNLGQKEALKKIPAEWSSLKHRYGVLSMARDDNDPDSAESSFSILLGDSPHLDGKYTIFGEVTNGFDVLKEILRIPRQEKSKPDIRITISSVLVVDSVQALEEIKLRPAFPMANYLESPQSNTRSKKQNRDTLNRESDLKPLCITLIMMVVISLLSFLLSHRLSLKITRSLNLINVLLGCFLLFSLLVPVEQGESFLAALIFFGLVGVFKIMNRFET